MEPGLDSSREQLKCNREVSPGLSKKETGSSESQWNVCAPPRGRRPWNLNKTDIRFHSVRGRGGGAIRAGGEDPCGFCKLKCFICCASCPRQLSELPRVARPVSCLSTGTWPTLSRQGRRGLALWPAGWDWLPCVLCGERHQSQAVGKTTHSGL